MNVVSIEHTNVQTTLVCNHSIQDKVPHLCTLMLTGQVFLDLVPTPVYRAVHTGT
jgi:hypothetical protein